jgi:hypothetical protein
MRLHVKLVLSENYTVRLVHHSVIGRRCGTCNLFVSYSSTLEYEVQYVDATYVQTFYDMSYKARAGASRHGIRGSVISFEFKSDYLFGVMRTFCT